MEIDQAQIFAISAIVFALFSEVVGLNSKWESNSIVQLFLSIGKKIFTKSESK